VIDHLRASPTGRRIHVVKTVTWRLVATTTTVVISYLVTGNLAVGATIGGIEATSKMALYYGHERAWARLLLVPARDPDDAAPAVSHHVS
jgi:uncharacterized membrane protein